MEIDEEFQQTATQNRQSKLNGDVISGLPRPLAAKTTTGQILTQ